MMKNKTLLIVNAVVAAGAAVAVNTILHPCRSEMPMHCAHTTLVGTVVLAALAALSIGTALMKNPKARKAMLFLIVLGAVAVFFVPTLGHCGGAMMHCNTHTMPAFKITGVLLLVGAVFSFTESFVHKREEITA